MLSLEAFARARARALGRPSALGVLGGADGGAAALGGLLAVPAGVGVVGARVPRPAGAAPEPAAGVEERVGAGGAAGVEVITLGVHGHE